MKAAVCTRYGPPEVIEMKDVEKPVPKDSEVLIEVRAASLNPLDGGLMKGKPYTFRLLTGLSQPKITQLGVDVAGRVEAVGRSVTQFKPGDEVFGVSVRYPQASGAKVWVCQGAFAEYVCASQSTLVMKPGNVTFEQAAAAPVAALTALQGLRDKGRVQPGQKVLINGAAGGVGTFAVQIAKSLGAYVTGVCSTKNVEMVRSIGADRVIDYMQEDFTKSGESYDVLFDLIGNHSLSACIRVVNRKGVLLLAGGAGSRWMIGLMVRPIKALLLSPFVSQKLVMFLARPSKEDLSVTCELMKAGKLTSVIDRSYRLNEVPEAIRYLEKKHARGKVIITF